MEGWDAREEKIYKRKRVYREGGSRHKYEDIEKKQEEHWEKRVNSNISCIIVASSGQLVLRNQLIHLFIFFFLPYFILGQSLLLVVCFPFLQIHCFGPQLNWSSHYYKWAWASSFPGPYTYNYIFLKIIFLNLRERWVIFYDFLFL